MRGIATLTAIACMAAATAAQARTFDFSSAIGATLPLSLASGGVTATFTAPAGNGYQVATLDGLLSFSPALVDNGFGGGDPLTITFSVPQTEALLIPFALLDAFAPAGQDTLQLAASDGETAAFATAPDSQTLQEPEGTVYFRPTRAITAVTLSSTQQIAIGNVTVPEPMSLALLATGCAAAFGLRRRR